MLKVLTSLVVLSLLFTTFLFPAYGSESTETHGSYFESQYRSDADGTPYSHENYFPNANYYAGQLNAKDRQTRFNHDQNHYGKYPGNSQNSYDMGFVNHQYLTRS
ncbi:MAG: hypothetical protein PHN49_07545 [Candidatus Omnitrophica bacterium]|nr:hypothetical protein [Candidatus Omnitrophota bacterium]MDD5671476.1 hypothetical protein [Candidatus Omnitrophota bacterium]